MAFIYINQDVLSHALLAISRIPQHHNVLPAHLGVNLAHHINHAKPAYILNVNNIVQQLLLQLVHNVNYHVNIVINLHIIQFLAQDMVCVYNV
jgi:hypothetical protein